MTLEQTSIVAIVAAVAGVAGAWLKSWIEQQTARRLGFPDGTEKKIGDLRKEFIEELEIEVERREEERDECLGKLAIEVAQREALEKKVDDQDIKISRLLRRLEDRE